MSLRFWILAGLVWLGGAAFAAELTEAEKTDLLNIHTTGNPSTAPLKWAGLLSYQTRQGSGICSAQFIAPRVLLTAAHCIQNPLTGDWHDVDKMYFYLQYQAGTFSRRYRAVCAARHDGWMPPAKPNATPEERLLARDAAAEHDYAMILVDAESPGRGHYRPAFNWWGKWKEADVTGYPGDVWRSAFVQKDTAKLFRTQDIPAFASKPNQLGMLVSNPRIKQGASGGAVVANPSAAEGNDANLVISVVSHGVTVVVGGYQLVPEFASTLPGVIIGPAFQEEAFNDLLGYVSRGCPADAASAPQGPIERPQNPFEPRR